LHVIKVNLKVMALTINNAVLTALAALAGSTVGALGPVLSNYVLQRSQTQRDLMSKLIAQRENLYSDFIKEASSVYANSVTTILRILTN
jgi:hypothetical protein